MVDVLRDRHCKLNDQDEARFLMNCPIIQKQPHLRRWIIGLRLKAGWPVFASQFFSVY